MAISLASLRRAGDTKPPIVLLHAVGGVGKTTLAASAPAPVFVQTEDGLRYGVETFGLLKTWADVMGALGALYTEDHQFRTLVIDSLDWLEPIVWAETCRRGDGSKTYRTIEDFGYGKGYAQALTVWREYIDGITALRDERNMAVIQIAHTEVKRFDSPETDPYDRYQIKLHKGAAALAVEHSDVVGFLNYRTSVVKTDVGFKKTIARGVGGGMRALFVEERPAFIAKNRYGMPEVIDLPDVAGNDPALWAAVARHVPALNVQLAKEAA
jgi:hypothetical protein